MVPWVHGCSHAMQINLVVVWTQRCSSWYDTPCCSLPLAFDTVPRHWHDSRSC
jgi:hypothetical protein